LDFTHFAEYLFILFIGVVTLLNSRELRLTKRESTADEVKLAPVKQSEQQAEISRDAISLAQNTLNGISNLATQVSHLVLEMHTSNTLQQQFLDRQKSIEAKHEQDIHELRSDISEAQNLLDDHVKVSTPAITAIVEQKPTVEDTHQRVVAAESVRQKMQEDIAALRQAFETFQKDVYSKLDAIAANIKTLIDTPQPPPAPVNVTTNVTTPTPISDAPPQPASERADRQDAAAG